MSEQVQVSREIAAPATAVWAMVSDVTRMGEWSPETVGCEWKRGATGPAVGARFTGTNANGSKRWTTTCTVVESVPGRSFVFDSGVGMVKVARWSYTFDETPTGCRVTETWIDQRNGLVKKLGKPLSGVDDRSSHNRQGMETTLARLAAAAETGA